MNPLPLRKEKLLRDDPADSLLLLPLLADGAEDRDAAMADVGPLL